MKTLYLDCGMGAAGDMLTGALLELLPDQEAFLEKLNGLGIPGVRVSRERKPKCGIMGTQISVSIDGHEETSDTAAHSHKPRDKEHHHYHHHHRSMEDMERIIKGLDLPGKVQSDVLAVYKMIAEAESSVHGVPVTEIHFHEVGAMDAVADITAVCLLMDQIAPEKVIVSPVHAGSGQVRCAHGVLPVPAPATAYILRGVPIYSGDIAGELCTPTGAALLKHFAAEFGRMPLMKTEAIGYGMGKKDFDRVNCVRALLGETAEQGDEVSELCCNLDDMTPEAIGFAMERFFEAGALEAYTTPIGMKKSRPGVLVSVMCWTSDRDKMTALIFKHTTTLGVRENISRRCVLSRNISAVETAAGVVRQKTSTGYGITKNKYEFEDLARIAREKDISLADALKLAEGRRN